MATTVAPATKPGVDVSRWGVIGLLVIGTVVAYLARANISVALVLPDFKQFFQLNDAGRGALNSAFFWSYAFLQIPAGWVVDRYGVKYPYAIAFLAWNIASAATALSATLTQLIALRIVLGVAEAVAMPGALRWVRFHFAEKQRGLAIGLVMAGAKIGPALAAPLAAWLISLYDWRTMFVIMGVGSLVWLLPWMFMARDDDRQLETAAAVATQTARTPFWHLMKSPVIWGTIVGSFCYMYFVYFCMTWMPAYFVERRHLSLTDMGLYTFFSFGGMAAVATLAGWAADALIARGRNPVSVRRAFTIAGFVVASTEVFGAMSDSVPVALFFAIFSLSGLGLATANYWALTQTLVPGGAVGRVAGIQNCAANLPGIVAPILTGWLKQTTGKYDAPMQAIWFFLIAGIAAYVFLVREKYAPSAVRGPA
jgi:MFS family permease